MAKTKITEVVTKIVDILSPLSSEERQRAIQASLTLLGDQPSSFKQTPPDASETEGEGGHSKLPPKARLWMKQNGISTPQLNQVFHIDGDTVDVIASDIPGKNKKNQTYAAYILTGISKLLATGSPSFDDKSARALCSSAGCYDNANHAVHLGNRGNLFTGSKEKGWTLTTPGLKRGAEIVKQLSGTEG